MKSLEGSENIACRVTLVIAVIASVHLAGLLVSYLYFAPAVRLANAVVQPVGFWTVDSLIGLGAYVLGGGDTGFIESATPRYATPAALMAASYFVGFAIVTGLVTAGWSLLDRRRTHYSTLHGWTRIYIRYLVSLVMMLYAFAKIIPTQFGFLAPGDMLRPFGDFSRFDVLWTFMRVSPGYTMFTGIVELTGALLLCFRATTLVGALITGAALVNVVALDAAYDIRGPLMVAGLLLLLDGIILLRYAPTLMKSLLLRSVDDPPREPLAPGASLTRGHSALAKAVLLAVLLSTRVLDGLEQRRFYFGADRQVYGLFDVERFDRSKGTTANGATDGATWRRIGTIGRTDNAGLMIRFADGEVRQFRLEDHSPSQQWTVRQRGAIVARLRYTVSSDGVVSLDGLVGEDQVSMRLRRVDLSAHPLLSAQ